MKITTLLLLAGLVLPRISFGQADIYVEVLAQTDCGLENPVGDLRFTGLSELGVDSVEITIYRSANYYATLWSSGDFDITIPVPPGYYQVFKSFWIDGVRDTIFPSSVYEMNSCTPFTGTLDILPDTNCGDMLAPVRLRAYSDQGLYVYAKLFNSTVLHAEFEAPNAGLGAIDTILSVPEETYYFHVAEYFGNSLYDVDWAPTTTVYPCALSTGMAEEFSVNVAGLSYEVLDSRGSLVRRLFGEDLLREFDQVALSPGMYVIRVMRGNELIRVERRTVLSW